MGDTFNHSAGPLSYDAHDVAGEGGALVGLWASLSERADLLARLRVGMTVVAVLGTLSVCAVLLFGGGVVPSSAAPGASSSLASGDSVPWPSAPIKSTSATPLASPGTQTPVIAPNTIPNTVVAPASALPVVASYGPVASGSAVVPIRSGGTPSAGQPTGGPSSSGSSSGSPAGGSPSGGSSGGQSSGGGSTAGGGSSAGGSGAGGSGGQCQGQAAHSHGDGTTGCSHHGQGKQHGSGGQGKGSSNPPDRNGKA